MPPPIQTQSGSRAALVTWTVVSSILFVVATVLAIFSSVAANKAQLELQTRTSAFNNVVAETDLNGEMITSLTAAKSANPTVYTGNLLKTALDQRDALARKIAPSASESAATTEADAALAKVKKLDGVKIAGDSLVSAVNALADEVASRGAQIKQITDAQADLTKKLAAVNGAFTAQMGAKDADIAKAVAAAQAADTGASTYRTTKDDDVKALQGQMDAQNAAAQETVNTLTAQGQEAATKAKKLEDQIKALNNKLGAIRQPVDQIVRQADAHVMRVGGEGILYIDLGTGDGVSAGMSFEIYDRIQGIPKSGEPTNDENLPKGKASIEILRVSPGSSECRIVRQTPGETVVEGDACVNLVYDRNVKYNLMVYGNFDLDRNGQTNPADTDVIKRLITRWGGKVVDKLTADTDFLVIGKVPEIPTYTQEELDRPEIQFEVEKKKKEVADFDELLGQAIQLNVPILNQNRFLYFTGYYEQSAR